MNRCPLFLLPLLLTGCVVDATRPSAGFEVEVRTATRRYQADLANAADVVGRRIESHEVDSNSVAFQQFQDASRAARERFNATVGAAFDSRCPPDGAPEAAAWHELANGFRPAQ